MAQLIDVYEQHIDPIVLPKESAACWIKWKQGAPFDHIDLRYEAGVEIHRLFNIDKDVFDNQDSWNGKITIPKSKCQLDGFFGFLSSYREIPDDDRKVSYRIDIVSGDKTRTIGVENTVSGPKIQGIKLTSDQTVTF